MKNQTISTSERYKTIAVRIPIQFYEQYQIRCREVERVPAHHARHLIMQDLIENNLITREDLTQPNTCTRN